jgi:hypothetical protein
MASEMKKVTDPAILAQLNGTSSKVTDPAILAQLEGQPQNPFTFARDAVESGQAQPRMGEDMGRTASAVQGFNSMIPFGERITAGLGSGLAYGADQIFGEGDASLSDLYKTARGNQAVTSESNPDYYTGGMGAGLVASLPMASTKVLFGAPAVTTGVRGAVNAIPTAFQSVGNFVRGSKVTADATRAAKLANLGGKALRSATIAAPSGALYSYGASQSDLDSPEALQDAASGAGMGAGFGAALPIAGALLNRAYEPLRNWALKNNAIKAGQILPERLPKELQKVYARLRADFPDDAEFAKVLNSYASTKDQALIQAGGARTANLAEGAAQYPSGGARATEFFDEAIGKAPDKLKATIGKTVSPSTRYYDDLDTMVAAGREKASPLYQAAYKNNQVVQSPVIDKILQTPEGKSALSEAVQNIQNEMARVAKPDPELTAIARELGVVSEGGVAKGLKLRTLDEVKKSMDGTINQAYRAGNEQEARRIINLKNALVNELDAADKSGFYSKARSVSGDYLSNKKAMDAGLSFLTDDSELIGRAYNAMGSTEKAAYRNGVVKAIRKQIEGTQDGANVARIFNKPATRDKLKSILKPTEYDKLLKDAKATDELFKLRNQLTGNSRTAARQIAAQEFDNEGAQLVEDLTKKGFSRTAIDKTAGWLARRFDGLSDKSAREVANILYETDPKKKFALVKRLTNQANMEGSNLFKLQAQRKLEAVYGIEDKVRGLSPEMQARVKAAQDSFKRVAKDESGSVPMGKPQIKSLNRPSSLREPTLPTRQQMDALSRVEKVDLKNAVSSQSKMDWQENKSGSYAEPLIKGYEGKPIAVKLQTGEYLIIDGNHRAVNAINAGQKNLDMHVIDASSYDPINAGLKSSAKPTQQEIDELLKKLYE